MAIALRTSVRELFELRFALRYLRIESQEGAIPLRERFAIDLPLAAERSCQNHRLNLLLDSIGASLQDVLKPKANAIASSSFKVDRSEISRRLTKSTGISK